MLNNLGFNKNSCGYFVLAFGSDIVSSYRLFKCQLAEHFPLIHSLDLLLNSFLKIDDSDFLNFMFFVGF